MNASPKDPSPPPKRPDFNATVPGSLYDQLGPIPVPETNESNTESVWALFEDVNNGQPKKPEGQTDFAPTDFEDRLLDEDNEPGDKR